MSLLIVLFAMAIAIWVVPLGRSAKPIAWPILVLVAGVVLGPSFFAINGPMQISIDRILWLALMVFVLVQLRIRNFSLPRPVRTDWIVAATVVYLLMSSLRGGEVPVGAPPLARWIFFVAMPAGMYFAMRMLPIGNDDVHHLSMCLIGLGSYLSVSAFLEVLGIHALVFPRFVVDPENWEFFGRGRGPLLNPTGNGFVITIALVLAAVGVFQVQGRKKVIFVALSILLFGGAIATLTRSVWMGAVLSLAMVSLVYTPRWVRVLGISVFVLMAGLLFLGLKEEIMRMKRDKHLTAADAEKSVQLRPLLAVVGWEMFKDRLLIGHGFGHYHEFSPPYHEIRSWGLPLKQARPYMQHNVVLSFAVDTGILGLVFIGSCFAIWSSFAWQLSRQSASEPHLQTAGLLFLGTTIAYLFNGMFQDISVIVMSNMFMMTVAGLVANMHASHANLVRSAKRDAAMKPSIVRDQRLPQTPEQVVSTIPIPTQS